MVRFPEEHCKFKVCIPPRRISELLLIRDLTHIPDVPRFEYHLARKEASHRMRKQLSRNHLLKTKMH